MFTGIIAAVGTITQWQRKGDDVRVQIAVGDLDMTDVALGDSIAVNGVCLTAVEFDKTHFSADVSGETLACTMMGDYGVGRKVNLEKALRLADRLGGHLVSGHVDGVGEITARYMDGDSWRFDVKVPKDLRKYVAGKGSIAINGISLTANAVDDDVVHLNIVPHTMAETTLADTAVGDKVNVEVDLIARHLERMLAVESEDKASSSMSMAFLQEHGFAKG